MKDPLIVERTGNCPNSFVLQVLCAQGCSQQFLGIGHLRRLGNVMDQKIGSFALCSSSGSCLFRVQVASALWHRIDIGKDSNLGLCS